MDELVRKLQPGIIVNDRGWGNGGKCDYSTPERNIKWDVSSTRFVEACDSVGVQSWGYRKDEDYHTLGYMTRKIDSFLSTGGNYLLNVGPKSDGTIPKESREIMAKVGRWYKDVRDSYRNVQTIQNMVKRNNAVVTRREDTLFIHFPKGLDANGVDLAPIGILPETAVVMNTGTILKTRLELMPKNALKSKKETLHVWGIPADELANEGVVLRLEFEKGDVEKAISSISAEKY
jgi:alpha-L-fucosidase